MGRPAEAPRGVVVLMRHGDRAPISPKIGALDASQLGPAFESLLPSEELEAELLRIPIHREEKGPTGGAYSKFVGVRPWGQLTGRGVEQCRAVGREVRRRYPKAAMSAFSTDFPRTLRSAAAFLLGCGDTEAGIHVRSAKAELLLPNFDGSCKRYARRRARMAALAKEGGLKKLREELEAKLLPLLGENPLQHLLDFRGFCVHSDVVGSLAGLDWPLLGLVEEHTARLDAACYEDPEVVKLACGRFLHWLLELLSSPVNEVTLLMAHDNFLSAACIALGVYREGEWPIYASTVVVEAADFGPSGLKVRVLVNDDVRRDWEALDVFSESMRTIGQPR